MATHRPIDSSQLVERACAGDQQAIADLLGLYRKAKTEYDRAVAEMKEVAEPDGELESLRRTTERLLAEDVLRESK